MIATEDLWQVYPGGVEAVRGLNLEVGSGRSFGLVGPNGAGKTTTIRMLAGLLPPTRGRVRILGADIAEAPEKVMPRIGYLPDEYGMYDNLRVWEYLDFYGRLHRLKKARRLDRMEHLLSLVRLGSRRDELVGRLSRGMRQRLMIARTLLPNPDVLLLDEPTSGLDPRSRAEVVEVLQHLARAGKTMLVASNILYDLSAFCDSLGIMNRGVLVARGSLDELAETYCRDRMLRIVVVSGIEKIEEVLASDDAVRSFTIEGNLVSLRYTGDARRVAELNEKLVRSGVNITGVCEERRTIEDVFLSVTQ